MGSQMEQLFLGWYDQYADAIFRYCYFRVYDYDRARDLVQEVFMRTWEYLGKGNVIRAPRPFLYRVATNCIINSVKIKKEASLDELQESVGFDPPDPHTEDHLFDAIDGRRILGVLHEVLDEPYQEVIILRFVNGLGPKEIAEITGESQNVISVRIHRALEKLRSVIQAKPYDTR